MSFFNASPIGGPLLSTRLFLEKGDKKHENALKRIHAYEGLLSGIGRAVKSENVYMRMKDCLGMLQEAMIEES